MSERRILPSPPVNPSSNAGSFRRNYYPCEFCDTVTKNLSLHLKRKCLAGEDNEKVKEVIERAHNRVYDFVRDNMVVSHERIVELWGSPDVDKAVQLLKALGHIVPETTRVTSNEAVAPPAQTSTDPGEGTSGQPEQSEYVADPPCISVDPMEGTSAQSEQCDEAMGTSGDENEGPETDVRTETHEEEESSDSLLDSPSYNWTDPIRRRMAEEGLYRLHSIEEGYLAEFLKYLKDNLHLRKRAYRQMVQSVARILYFVDPAKQNIHAIQPEKVQEFFAKMKETNASQQTVGNYQKCLKRFVLWITTCRDIRRTDYELYKQLKYLLKCMTSWSKEISRGVAREEVSRKVNQTVGGIKTVELCQTILRVAKEDFLKALENKSDYTLVVNYLTALLTLKHFQRKGVVENFRVSEWRQGVELTFDEKKYVTFYVKEHKTGGTQPATFCLTEEEYKWFDKYFLEIRPRVTRLKGATCEYFFLSTTGKAIYNASNDINRLHKKYKLPTATGNEARKAMETSTKGRLRGEDLTLVEDYLAHSASVANRHYRLKEPVNVCRAMLLMENVEDLPPVMSSPSSSPTSTDTDSSAARPIAAASYHRQSAEINAAYNQLIQQYPVNIEKQLPKTSLCKKFYSLNPRALINKWRYNQTIARVQFLVDMFPRRRPSREQVLKVIEERGWPVTLSNQVMGKWRAGNIARGQENKAFEKHIVDQLWPGIATSRTTDRGQIVLATRNFSKGDVVCDYHGEVITYAEGESRQQHVKEDGYIFFVREKNMAIDARLDFCLCHPGRLLYGRLIAHSRKTFNLKPVLHEMGNQTVVIFKATRDIVAGEEIKFDYGVRQSMFHEGQDLDWLQS